MQIALEDIYAETAGAYYVKIGGQRYGFLKSEVRKNGSNIEVPDNFEEYGNETVIKPAEMARQKNQYGYSLDAVAEFWGLSSTMTRKILIDRGYDITRTYPERIKHKR